MSLKLPFILQLGNFNLVGENEEKSALNHHPVLLELLLYSCLLFVLLYLSSFTAELRYCRKRSSRVDVFCISYCCVIFLFVA